MIQSKNDYLKYLQADALALHHSKASNPRKFFKYVFEDELFRYEHLLREVEYNLNCRRSRVGHTYALYLWHRLNKLGARLGFDISPNCFDHGLGIIHKGPIIVHYRAKIGCNCRIYPMVVIGEKSGKVPQIGNNVILYPGAKVIGDVVLADGIKVGANAVVTKCSWNLILE